MQDGFIEAFNGPSGRNVPQRSAQKKVEDWRNTK
jgi:hypothetical protein